jgi:hypothetical protein
VPALNPGVDGGALVTLLTQEVGETLRVSGPPVCCRPGRVMARCSLLDAVCARGKGRCYLQGRMQRLQAAACQAAEE